MSQQSPDGSVRSQRRGAAVLLVLLTSLPLWGAPAAAVPIDVPGPPAARLIVNGLTAVVGPEGDGTIPEGEEELQLPRNLEARVLVQNIGDQPLDGLRLVLTLHRRVTTRSDLRRALDTDPGPVERVAVDEPLEPLPPGAFAQVELTVPAADLDLVDPADDVTIHPLTLSLARAVGVLDQVRTAAVGVARPIARPLETVAVAPLDSPVEGTAADTAELLPGGRLDRVLRALESAPAGTATLAAAPHTAEDLGGLVADAVPGATDMAMRLGTVVRDHGAGVVSMPYALADVPALAASSATRDLAGQAIVAGRQRMTSALGVEPDATHLLVSDQSEASVQLAPYDVLVATWDDALGPDLEENPSADIPSALRTGRSQAGRSFLVLMGDPWMTDHLAAADGANGWAVEAHRIVVESAMLFAAAPGREGRVAAIVPPVGWAAPGRLPDELYTRLAAAPWLHLDNPVTVAARGTGPAPWQPASGVTPDRTVLLGRVAAIERRLSGLTSAVAGLDDPPAVVTRGDELLRAMSTWPSPDGTDRGTRLLDGLEDDIATAIGVVAIPDDIAVTLTSERGVIPVTIQHPEGVPLDVLVEVEAQGRLTFQNGTTREVTLEEGGTATVSFETTALARGGFPARVTVRTPGREVVLTTEDLQVRATAVSRPALVAVAVIVVLLLLVGRSRRPRQPRLEVVR